MQANEKKKNRGKKKAFMIETQIEITCLLQCYNFRFVSSVKRSAMSPRPQKFAYFDLKSDTQFRTLNHFLTKLSINYQITLTVKELHTFLIASCLIIPYNSSAEMKQNACFQGRV